MCIRDSIRANAGRRWRRELGDDVEELAYTDVGQRRTEEQGRGGTGVEGIEIEWLKQLEGVECFVELGAYVRPGRIHAEVLLLGQRRATRCPLVQRDVLGTGVQEPPKVACLPDRPGHGGGTKIDPLFKLVAQRQGLAAGPIPLVDKGDDRDAPESTHLEQLQRCLLYTSPSPR